MGILGLPRGFWDPPDGILGPPPPDSGPARGNSAPSLPNELVNSINPSPHCGPPPVPKLVLTGLPQPGSQVFCRSVLLVFGRFWLKPHPEPGRFWPFRRDSGAAAPPVPLGTPNSQGKTTNPRSESTENGGFCTKTAAWGAGGANGGGVLGQKGAKNGIFGFEADFFSSFNFFHSFGPSLSGLMANLAITKWRHFGELIFDLLVLFFYPF